MSRLQGVAEILEQTCKNLGGAPPYATLLQKRVDVDNGIALWKALSDARDKK